MTVNDSTVPFFHKHTQGRKSDISIDLTSEQIKLLEPLIANVKQAFRDGRPGIIVAQVYTFDKNADDPILLCKFVDHDTANKLMLVFRDKRK